jgi:RNA recognition motif-containing protein
MFEDRQLSQSRLYVGNHSFDTGEIELKEAFGAFGDVRSVNVVTDRETGRPRGFSFVEMGSDAEAQAAIDGLNGADVGGRALNVNVAKPRENRDGGGRRDRY